MATRLFSGIRGTTTKTGTGSYSSITAVDSWRTFAAITDNDLTYVCALAEDGTFEIFKATKSGGSSPVLARTEIVVQTDGTTDPVDWDTNTPLTLYTVAPGEILPLLSGTNSWTADQTITGTNKLKFADGGQYIYSPVDGQLAIYADATSASFENGEVKIYKSDDGASAGPILNLRRTTASPAASDLLGRVLFMGSDSGGSMVNYASVVAQIIDASSGGQDGKLLLQAVSNNLLFTHMDVSIFGVFVKNTGVFATKDTTGIANNGFEVNQAQTYCTSENNTALHLNRKGNDGKLIAFYRDGSEQGSIGVLSGTVSLAGAVMSHPSDWDGDPWDGDLIGVVVCSAEGVLADDAKRHPRCTVSSRERDSAVYGVVQGRLEWGLSDGTKLDALNVEAVGSGLIRVVGPVKRGDLLETSPVPGTAWAQADDLVRASTVAKAVQDSPDDGTVRLVPCTLMAG